MGLLDIVKRFFTTPEPPTSVVPTSVQVTPKKSKPVIRSVENAASIGIRFGGGDTRSIRWLAEHKEFRITALVKRNHEQLLRFLQREYLEKGAALFGRRSPEALQDFRQAAGGELDHCSDEVIALIIQDAVQTIRNRSHLQSLIEAIIEEAEIVAVCDPHSCQSCSRKNGTRIKVKINSTEIPPYHSGCRCRLIGVVLP